MGNGEDFWRYAPLPPYPILLKRFHDQVRKAKKYRDEEKLRHKKVNEPQARAENNPHNRNILLELDWAQF